MNFENLKIQKIPVTVLIPKPPRQNHRLNLKNFKNMLQRNPNCPVTVLIWKPPEQYQMRRELQSWCEANRSLVWTTNPSWESWHQEIPLSPIWMISHLECFLKQRRNTNEDKPEQRRCCRLSQVGGWHCLMGVHTTSLQPSPVDRMQMTFKELLYQDFHSINRTKF